METNIVTLAQSGIRTFDEDRSINNQLGKDDFLQILVAQLSNQNPMEPADDTAFITQLAQFSVLEQMQALNAGFMTSQAYDMIGKYVHISDPVEGEAEPQVVFGKVDGAVKRDGIDYLLVGDEEYSISTVVGVLDGEAIEGNTEEQILQSANLIGKTVTAAFTDELENEVAVAGQVEKIIIEDNTIYAVVGGVNVPLSSIEEITS